MKFDKEMRFEWRSIGEQRMATEVNVILAFFVATTPQ